MGIFTKGINKAAFSGRLTCPVCRSEAIRYVENIGPYRIRYRCRKCGMPFQYETGRDMRIHPYAAFTKQSKWREIVESGVQAKQFLSSLRGRKRLT